MWGGDETVSALLTFMKIVDIMVEFLRLNPTCDWIAVPGHYCRNASAAPCTCGVGLTFCATGNTFLKTLGRDIVRQSFLVASRHPNLKRWQTLSATMTVLRTSAVSMVVC